MCACYVTLPAGCVQLQVIILALLVAAELTIPSIYVNLYMFLTFWGGKKQK
jgi:hypothetical protein